jgi:hypothetical protein
MNNYEKRTVSYPEYAAPRGLMCGFVLKRVRCEEGATTAFSHILGSEIRYRCIAHKNMPGGRFSDTDFGNPDLPCTCTPGQPVNPNCMRHGRRN